LTSISYPDKNFASFALIRSAAKTEEPLANYVKILRLLITVIAYTKAWSLGETVAVAYLATAVSYSCCFINHYKSLFNWATAAVASPVTAVSYSHSIIYYHKSLFTSAAAVLASLATIVSYSHSIIHYQESLFTWPRLQ
jgi:hypothetical protein